MIDKIKKWWHSLKCEHEKECHGYDESVTPSSEKFYWHKHTCTVCGLTASELTVTCILPKAQ